MLEFAPFLLSVGFGTVIWRTGAGRTRFVLGACAVALCGAAATLISGEYVVSPVYLLLDVAEAALGMAIGIATADGVLQLRRSGRQR